MTDGPTASAPRSLADRLNALFDRAHPNSRGPWSTEEVAAGIRDSGGPTISATYIWQLRRGVRDNPTKHHLEALARFFHVPASYFFDEEAAERIHVELELLAAMRDQGVLYIAQRTAGLDPGSIEVVRALVDHVRELKGLDPPAAATPAEPDPPRRRASDQADGAQQ